MKLMAGFGALLGAGRLMWAALWTAGVGGVIALGRALACESAMRRHVRMPDKDRGAGEEQEREDSIPYAPAITLGVWLSLVPKG